jgi:hypothetical protein
MTNKHSELSEALDAALARSTALERVVRGQKRELAFVKKQLGRIGAAYQTLQSKHKTLLSSNNVSNSGSAYSENIGNYLTNQDFIRLGSS